MYGTGLAGVCGPGTRTKTTPREPPHPSRASPSTKRQNAPDHGAFCFLPIGPADRPGGSMIAGVPDAYLPWPLNCSFRLPPVVATVMAAVRAPFAVGLNE